MQDAKPGSDRSWITPIGSVVAGLGLWLIANFVWLHAHRSTRLYEQDEAGFAAQTVRFARQTTLADQWDAIRTGPYGPAQSLLAAPVQWIVGVDAGVVMWQNVLLTVGAAAAVTLVVARLAGLGAGAVAGALVLLSTGLIDHARSALPTSMTLFVTALAMAALVAGEGLRDARWSALLGGAIGAMLLSPPTAVALLPGVIVAAAGFVVATRTPRRTVITSSVLATAVAAAVCGWWWAGAAEEVVDYLGSGTWSPAQQLADAAGDVVVGVGPATLVAGLLAALVSLRRRRGARHRVGVDAVAVHLPLWPLVAAAATSLVVSVLSSTVHPRSGLVAVSPWLLAAGVAAMRRRTTGHQWRMWSVAVLSVALAAAVITTIRGLEGTSVWCTEPWPDDRLTCEVTAPVDQRSWHRSVDELTAVTFGVWSAHEDAGADRAVGIVGGDPLVNAASVSLAGELRHDWTVAPVTVDGPLTAASLDRVARRAHIVVAVPDPPGAGGLPAAEVLAALADSGFVPCSSTPLPDGRVAQVVVRTPSTQGCGV